jgi:hypothetical protein
MAFAALALCTGFVSAWADKEPPSKPPIEEEEAAPARTPRPPLRVGDESAAPRLPLMAQEAEKATNPAARRLFQALAAPHDEVTWTSNLDKATNVLPLARHVGQGRDLKGNVNLQILNEQGQPGSMRPFPMSGIKAVTYFEEKALARIDEFLKAPAKDDGPDSGLARAERLVAAEKALAAVQLFHQSARDQGEEAGWSDVSRRLREKLLGVRLEQLTVLAEGGDWTRTLDLAARLAKGYPDPAVRDKLSEPLGRLMESAIDRKDYRTAQLRLKIVDQQFPNSTASRRIGERLQQEAARLLDLAREKEKTDHKAAVELLDAADAVWPRLSGLRDFRLRMVNAFPMPLGVGVHELPENLSPGTAVTDGETSL